MTTAAVIVAAGRGVRAGGGIPKQWRDLRGRTVLAWTLRAFRTSPAVARVVLVLHPDDMGTAAGYAAHEDVEVVAGGATRAASVRAGLESLADRGIDRVLIHDVARPLVSQTLIARVAAALDRSCGAAPALPVTDALWRVEDGRVDRRRSTAPGSGGSQTPQGFRFDAILAAHRRHAGGALGRRGGGARGRAGRGGRSGRGKQHQDHLARGFRPGRETAARRKWTFAAETVSTCTASVRATVWSCAASTFPMIVALVGHSDADVGLHAITDAIYGALGEGDIGRHFPPSDARWAGADSRIFLEHAVSRAARRGFRIDEHRLHAHLRAAQDRSARRRDDRSVWPTSSEISPDRISVKATTSERLGFTGRGEGIAALATVTLVSL